MAQKNIAIITGANDTASPSDYRFDGYKAVMDAQNLETNGIRLKSDSSELLKQIEIEKLLKDESIDGIFCTDDLTAVTVINIATRIGINVPTDLKVVGYDGTKLLHQLAPYLSTVVQPIDEMCDVMIELLMKRIEDADVILEETYSLPARVALSESC